MVAFTRFSFLMRRVFFRLMHQDLNTILDGLRELEARGVDTLDCRSAQFSADEPVTRLRMICQSWKVMFHAEYSSGSPLRMLVDLRNVVDAALARTARKAEKRRAGLNRRPSASAPRPQPLRPVHNLPLPISEGRRVRSHRRSRLGPDRSRTRTSSGKSQESDR